MWQKLTYSDIEVNNYVYFAFDAEIFDVSKVTEELGIEPTKVMIKGNPIPKSTSWKFEIKGGNDIFVEKIAKKLIQVFEPKIDIINTIKEKYNLTTRLEHVIHVDVNPNASTPIIGIDIEMLDFLHRTNTKVDYDIYKADSSGIMLENNK